MGMRAARAFNPANVSITGGSGVPIVNSSYQSYTAVVAPADTNENILATINIGAGDLGVNGGFELYFYLSCTSNANVKTIRVRWSGIGGTILFTRDAANFGNLRGYVDFGNRGVTNSQQYESRVMRSDAAWSITGSGTTAVDTTAASTVVITCTKATAGDTVTLELFKAQRTNPAT
jgi:hypothetical protein